MVLFIPVNLNLQQFSNVVSKYFLINTIVYCTNKLQIIITDYA